MVAAEAPALVAPTTGIELDRRLMAAVNTSEARGDRPLLRAVEVARLVSGEGTGLPSAELAGILAHGSSPLIRAPHTGASARPIAGHLRIESYCATSILCLT